MRGMPIRPLATAHVRPSPVTGTMSPYPMVMSMTVAKYWEFITVHAVGLSSYGASGDKQGGTPSVKRLRSIAACAAVKFWATNSAYSASQVWWASGASRKAVTTPTKRVTPNTTAK